jgi:hypothetical protein
LSCLALPRAIKTPAKPVISARVHGATSYKPVDVTEVDGKPIIDTYVIFPGTNIIVKCQYRHSSENRFLGERIISLNVFGCPLSSRENHLKDAEAKKD